MRGAPPLASQGPRHGPSDASDRWALPGPSLVHPLEGATVFRTPDRLTHAHGQRLVLAQGPRPGSLDGWVQQWLAVQRQWGEVPRGPLVVQWETTAAEPPRLPPERQRLDLVARRTVAPLPPLSPAADLQIQPLQGDDNWEAAASLCVDVQSERDEVPADEATLRWMYQAWRQAVIAPTAAEVAGTWIGIWQTDRVGRRRLVASTGVFVGPDGAGRRIARLQDVQVDARQRGRGLGALLVTTADAWARQQQATALWSVTERGSDGDRLYTRLGMEVGAWVYERAVPIHPHARRG